MTARSRLKVVICDDHHDQSLLFKVWLSDCDVEVLGCPHTRELAVMMCEEFNPDVLVMDYQMPEEAYEGVGAIKITQLRDLVPNTAILLWTGYERSDLPTEVIVAVNGVLVKSIDRDRACAAVQTVGLQGAPVRYD